MALIEFALQHHFRIENTFHEPPSGLSSGTHRLMSSKKSPTGQIFNRCIDYILISANKRTSIVAKSCTVRDIIVDPGIFDTDHRMVAAQLMVYSPAEQRTSRQSAGAHRQLPHARTRKPDWSLLKDPSIAARVRAVIDRLRGPSKHTPRPRQHRSVRTSTQHHEASIS